MRSDYVSSYKLLYTKISKLVLANKTKSRLTEFRWVLCLLFSPSVFIFLHVLLSSGHMARLCKRHVRISGDVQRFGAADTALDPIRSKQIRRDAGVHWPLTQKSPLVHSTPITKLARPALDPDRRAERADLICLLTDGSSITHSLPPASHVEMEWPPTVRLERAHRRRT